MLEGLLAHRQPMAIFNHQTQMSIVPDEVRAAFAGRPAIGMPQLAQALRIDIKTLIRHRDAGDLPVHIKGTGLVRRRYVCTIDDIVEFYRRTAVSVSGDRA